MTRTERLIADLVASKPGTDRRARARAAAAYRLRSLTAYVSRARSRGVLPGQPVGAEVELLRAALAANP